MGQREQAERLILICAFGVIVVALATFGLGSQPDVLVRVLGAMALATLWVVCLLVFLGIAFSSPVSPWQRSLAVLGMLVITVLAMWVGLPAWVEVWDRLGGHNDLPRYSLTGADYSTFAEHHYQRGEYYEAVADYSEAIRLAPDWAMAYYKRGMCYYWLCNHEEAVENYSEAIRLDPESAGPYAGRAWAYYESAGYTRAISDCDSALSLSPEYREAYRTRGLAFHALGDYEEAIEDYTAALGINPSYHEVYYDRGCAYALLGEYEEAEADYSEAIRLNPNYALAVCQRGLVYQELDRTDEALEDFQSCLALATQDERLRDEAQGYVDQLSQR